MKPTTCCYLILFLMLISMLVSGQDTLYDKAGAPVYKRIVVTPPTVNKPPTVAMTMGTSAPVGEVTITATAADADGTVTKVEFLINGTKQGEDTTLPYIYRHTFTTQGTYALTARATDNSGAVTTSAVSNLSVYTTTPPTGSRRLAPTGTDTGDCSVNPCKTWAYTVTKAQAGEWVTAAPGTYTETAFVMVPPGVNIELNGSTVKGAANLWDDFDDYNYKFSKALFQFVSNSETDGKQTIRNGTIDGTGSACSDGVGPPCNPALNDRGMYAGIWIYNRNNVTVDKLTVRKCFFTGIYISNTRNAKVINSTFRSTAYGQSAFASGQIMWGKEYNDDMVLAYNDHDEDFGNAAKAFSALGNNDAVQGVARRFDIHHNRFSVIPTGQWAGGSAPNIAVENWGVKMERCKFHDNYTDNTISLVSNWGAHDGIPTVAVYNNRMDMLARSNGMGYALELSINYVEVYGNYFIGGRFASIADYSTRDYPKSGSGWYGFWNIHHNTFLAPKAVYPSPLVRAEWHGLHEVKLNNNTIEVDYAGAGVQNFVLLGSMQSGGTNQNVEVKGNIVWGKAGAGTNKTLWFVGTQTANNVVISGNDFFNLPETPWAGVTYSANVTYDPNLQKTGAKPDPYYRPQAGSPVDVANIGAWDPQGTTPPTTPGVITIDNTDPAMVYTGSWFNGPTNAPGFIQNTMAYSNVPGDMVSYLFNGTGIDVFMETKVGHGRGSIQIDNNPENIMNFGVAPPDSTMVGSRNVLTVNNLPAGPHTIKIKVLDPLYIVFDAIKVTGGAQAVQTSRTVNVWLIAMILIILAGLAYYIYRTQIQKREK